MKAPILLHLAAFSAAFVIPDEQVSNLQHVEIQRHPRPSALISDFLQKIEETKEYGTKEAEDIFKTTLDKLAEVEETSRHALDEALATIQETTGAVTEKIEESYFDTQAWLEAFLDNDGVVAQVNPFDEAQDGPHHGPPKDGPPHHGPPKDGHGHHNCSPPHDGHPPHHGPPHHGPPHHGKPNMTVYQLISSSKYTTKLAKLINKYDDIVEALNSTEVTNFTIFAPTDRAFEKIPEHAHKPSEAQLKALLQYHISGDFYPAGRILASRTIPSLFIKDTLGDKPHPQRLSTNIGPRGLTVNFYSRVVAVDIFGTNGVIHGVDSIIIPPPKTLKIIDLLPSEFSTLELGLGKTGLLEELNSTHHAGGTFFAPSNWAFQKLGPRINAFLFSSHGQKYLKALLQYHIVANQTLYSDAYYGPSSADMSSISQPKKEGGCHGRRSGSEKRTGVFGRLVDKIMPRDDHHGPPHHGPPRGFFHIDLPTMLEDKTLSIDIARYGRLIDIKINGFSRVVVSDGVAEDGVLHVVGDVLIPPKKLGMAETGEELSVEELKERLAPYVEDDGTVEEDDEASWSDL